MKMFPLLLTVLVTVILVGSVAAQEAEEESVKDFMELSLFGGGSLPVGGISSWSTSSPETGTEEFGAKFGYSFGFDVGHFLTPDLVVGVTFTYAQYGIDTEREAVADMHHRLIAPAVYVKKYFQGESNWLPYLKGSVGVDVLKFATRVFDPNVDFGGYEYRELSYHPAVALGIGGGVMYYTFDYGGLYAEANYHMAFSSDVVSEYENQEYTFGESASMLDLHAGVKVFFGGE